MEPHRAPPLQLHLDERAGAFSPQTSARIVDLIAAAKTKTGLTVHCARDPNWYATSARVSDADFASIPLRRHGWHGEWNYDVAAS